MKATKSVTALIVAAGLTAALSALSVPAVATARPLPARAEARIDTRLDVRIGSLSERIRIGERTHQLSRREANRLDARLSDIRAQKRQFERSGRGLSFQETATLNARLDTLSGQVRVQGHDHNRR